MARRMYRHTRRPPSRFVKSESRTHRLQEQNRTRLASMMLGVGLSFAVLALRLIEVATIGGGDLPFKRLVSEPHLMLEFQEAQERGVATLQEEESPRREIVDRNGLILATNLPAASLAVNPQLIRDKAQTAAELADALEGISREQIFSLLSHKKSRFAYIKRHLTPVEQERVHRLGIPGLFFEQGHRRVYPFGQLAAHVLGFVDIDNHGLAGIERHFDKRLHYARRNTEPLMLSIDMRVQALMMQELQAVMQKFSAIAAAGLVMDVHSGELIAMTSLPSFDPHQPASASEEARFNRISLGTYELGSSFKTFTLALGLDKKAISLRDGYDTSYAVREAGVDISDYKPFYRWLSIPEIFAFSSNVGTVKILQDVGFSTQKDFLRSLGMFEPVEIELPERAHPLLPKGWTPADHMTASYGHGISVSPLHLGRAMAAMVNGGELPQLTLIKNGTQDKGERRRVISEATSRDVRDMMRLVVDYGTARFAQVNGYGVGGKTGTAEKIIHGRYDDNKKITSFVSAFPIENPQYLMFIMVDEPKPIKETHGYATGGWVAAPVTARLIERIAPMLGLAPKFAPPNPKEVEYWEASRRRNDEARQAWHRGSRTRGIHAAAY